ncbi:MAG TPA: aldehyde dehydrogenase family protein, partial [Terriglobales bacterium]|nr:aldehyde dehydrogenase family protein [Terriglobales bacterium]
MAASKTRVEAGKLLIGGEWVATPKSFDSINPATGEILAQVAEAGPAEVDRAVKAARKAFDD